MGFPSSVHVAGSSGMTYLQRKRAADEAAALSVLRYMSRFAAFRGNDGHLAEELGWGIDKLRAVLKRLRASRRVWSPGVRTFTVMPDEFRSVRTLYLVNPCDPMVGALRLAMLVQKRGDEVVDMETGAFCGQLACTPGQFKRWLKVALRQRFVSVDYYPVLYEVGPVLEIARRRREVRPGPRIHLAWIRWRDPMFDKLVKVTDENLERDLIAMVEASLYGVCTRTKKEIAQALRSDVRAVYRQIAKSEKAGRMFTYPFAHGRRGSILSTRSLTPCEVEAHTPKRRADGRPTKKMVRRKRKIGARTLRKRWVILTDLNLIESAAQEAFAAIPETRWIFEHGGPRSITKNKMRHIVNTVGRLVRDEDGWKPAEVAERLAVGLAEAHLVGWWEKREKLIGVDAAIAERDQARAQARVAAASQPVEDRLRIKHGVGDSAPVGASELDVDALKRLYPWWEKIDVTLRTDPAWVPGPLNEIR